MYRSQTSTITSKKDKFSHWQHVCEINYQCFLQLVHMPQEQIKLNSIPQKKTIQHLNTITSIEVISSHPYTTCFNLKLMTDDWPKNLDMPCLEVRLYHDLKIAEVHNASALKNLPLNYKYSVNTHQLSEKLQNSYLLYEWIFFLLSNDSSLLNGYNHSDPKI